MDKSQQNARIILVVVTVLIPTVSIVRSYLRIKKQERLLATPVYSHEAYVVQLKNTIDMLDKKLDAVRFWNIITKEY